MFPTEGIGFEDFCLLEGFQLGYLEGWVPEAEFAVCLHAWPHVARLLERRHPPIGAFLARILREHGPAGEPSGIDRAEQKLVTTCADILLYVTHPEAYDELEFAKLEYLPILEGRVPVEGAVVIDAAAGTGAVSLSLCSVARTVFAVEPVGRLREHIRERASRRGVTNVHVIDGFLHSIPLPDGFADVLVASQALGWRPDEEVDEIERVVKPGGVVAIVNDDEKREMLEPAGYHEEAVAGHDYLLLFTKTIGSS